MLSQDQAVLRQGKTQIEPGSLPERGLQHLLDDLGDARQVEKHGVSSTAAAAGDKGEKRETGENEDKGLG